MIKIKGKTKTTELTLDEFTRWSCLVEAIQILNEKADEIGVELMEIIKPSAIETYITERYPSLRYDMGVEFNNL